MRVVGTDGELFFGSSVDAVGEEDERSADLVFDQQPGVAEVVDHALLALDASVGDVADLEAVELLPSVAVELLEEGHYVLWLHEVDEGVANVALVLEVDRQVEEVELTTVGVQSREKHLLTVLVGDVLDHERRSGVVSGCDALNVQLEVQRGGRAVARRLVEWIASSFFSRWVAMSRNLWVTRSTTAVATRRRCSLAFSFSFFLFFHVELRKVLVFLGSIAFVFAVIVIVVVFFFFLLEMFLFLFLEVGFPLLLCSHKLLELGAAVGWGTLATRL